jgi:predicted  nucleic acid-binding Zn-ribbon protein
MTAAKETTLKEVGEMLTHVVTHMATKEDVARIDDQLHKVDSRLEKVETRLTSIESELKSIRRDLDDLREKVENVVGFRKEIDHALERITAIEKHLGIGKKIAA